MHTVTYCIIVLLYYCIIGLLDYWIVCHKILSVTLMASTELLITELKE